MMNHFPSQRKSFTQKGKTWRRDCVDYVCSEADNYQTSNYKRMFENYQMYLDQLNQDDYRSWADPLDLDSGQSKDYVYAFNMAHNKIKIHLGEELQRPFYYSAISLNPEDSNEIIRQRNNDYKQYLQLIIDKEIEKIQLMQKIEQEAQARSGLTNAELKKMQEESDAKFAEIQQMVLNPLQIKAKFANYKLPKEKLAAKVLKQYELNHKLKYKKNQAIEHFLISGLESVMVEEINGEAVITPLNSLGVTYHKSPEEPFIHNGMFACYKREMTTAEVLDMWGDLMAEKDKYQLEHLNNVAGLNTPLWSKDGFSENHWENRGNRNVYWEGESSIPHEGSYGQSSSRYENLTVYTCFWRSQRQVYILTTKDDYGNEIEEFLDEKFEIPEDAIKIQYTDKRGAKLTKYQFGEQGEYSIESIWIPEIWQGTRIEDNIYVNIEPLTYNQPTIRNPMSAQLPIYGIVSDSKNGPIVSLWDRMKPWQKLYYFIMSKFLKLIALDRPIVTLLNILMVDKKIGIDQTMKHLVDNAILPYNPLAHEQGQRLMHSMKAAETLNLSNTQQIRYYADILRFIEEKIGDSAGVPKSREGNTSTGSNVSDNRQDLVQASTISEPTFYHHELLWEDILNAVLRICTQNIDNKGIINRAILSDEEIAIIENEELNRYDEFDVKISNSRKAHEIVQLAKSNAQALIQNDKITLSQFIELVGMENIAEFKLYIREIEEGIKQRQEAMSNSQFESQEKMKQMEIETREDEQKHEYDLQERKYVHEKELKAMDVYKFQQDQDVDKDGMPDAIESYVKMNKLMQENEKINLAKETLEFQKDKAEKDRNLKRQQGNKKS